MSSSNSVGGIPPVTPQQMNANTEQALVELVYVKTGNEIIGNAMLSLESALQTTQSVLNILQQLQNLHNQLNVNSPSAFNFPYKSGPYGSIFIHGGQTVSAGGVGTTSANITMYEKSYLQHASAYYGKQITPYLALTGTMGSFINTLKNIKSNLTAEFNSLFKQTPANARGDSTSLLGQLRTVLEQLPSVMTSAAVRKWVLDNYSALASGASLTGNIENALTSAITAAESLNDTQKEQVRRYLYIFQEFYQSAASVLSQITQIIQMMAQKISS